MLGSVLLGSSHAPNFSLSRLADVEKGSHASGRYCGDYEYSTPDHAHSPLFLPSRDKNVELYCSARTLLDPYLDTFARLDSEYPGETWHTKVENIRNKETPHTLLMSTSGTHGTFTLVSTDVPIQFVAVFHPQIRSFHLVWSTVTTDLVTLLRKRYQLEYVFFRFPTVVNNTVFLPIQPLSAHWWRYTKNNDTLFAMNVMESKIFKNRE